MSGMNSSVPRLYKVGDDAKLVNGSGTEVGTSTNRLQVEARNTDTFDIYNDILKELKKMNMHLSIINDQIITNQEIVE